MYFFLTGGHFLFAVLLFFVFFLVPLKGNLLFYTTQISNKNSSCMHKLFLFTKEKKSCSGTDNSG